MTFPIMQLVATPGALELDRVNLVDYLNRHIAGDYGEVNNDLQDKAMNDRAAKTQRGIVFSTYHLNGHKTLNIKTDFYAGCTTIYLPEED